MKKINIKFYINGIYKEICVNPEDRLIDVIREKLGLLGSKEGCGDGDCGACTVVLGSISGDSVSYNAIVSCLTPVAKIHGKSLITVEGLQDNKALHLIQDSIVDKHGAQCGFCSPGIVMALFGLVARKANPTYEEMKTALAGNICRCTGYEGIKNAAKSVIKFIAKCSDDFDIVPHHIREVEKKLPLISKSLESATYKMPTDIDSLINYMKEFPDSIIVAGCTDIGVKKHITGNSLEYVIDVSRIEELKVVEERGDNLFIGANLELQQIDTNKLLSNKLPVFRKLLPQMASEQIRNVATLGGNICNASPIGDCVVLLMALDASVLLCNPKKTERIIPIRDFYKGYKITEKQNQEVLLGILIPKENYHMNISFIKSGKRNGVDIASVNSVSRISISKDKIVTWEIAIGGIAPTIIYQKLPEVAVETSVDEIKKMAKNIAVKFSPISDVRGSSEFRSLLIEGHIVKHFLRQTGREDSQ